MIAHARYPLAVACAALVSCATTERAPPTRATPTAATTAIAVVTGVAREGTQESAPVGSLAPCTAPREGIQDAKAISDERLLRLALPSYRRPSSRGVFEADDKLFRLRGCDGQVSGPIAYENVSVTVQSRVSLGPTSEAFVANFFDMCMVAIADLEGEQLRLRALRFLHCDQHGGENLATASSDGVGLLLFDRPSSGSYLGEPAWRSGNAAYRMVVRIEGNRLEPAGQTQVYYAVVEGDRRVLWMNGSLEVTQDGAVVDERWVDARKPKEREAQQLRRYHWVGSGDKTDPSGHRRLEPTATTPPFSLR